MTRFVSSRVVIERIDNGFLVTRPIPGVAEYAETAATACDRALHLLTSKTPGGAAPAMEPSDPQFDPR